MVFISGVVACLHYKTMQLFRYLALVVHLSWSGQTCAVLAAFTLIIHAVYGYNVNDCRSVVVSIWQDIKEGIVARSSTCRYWLVETLRSCFLISLNHFLHWATVLLCQSNTLIKWVISSQDNFIIICCGRLIKHAVYFVMAILNVQGHKCALGSSFLDCSSI